MELTPLTKGLIGLGAVVVVGGAAYAFRDVLAPPAKNQVESNIPPTANLPADPSQVASIPAITAPPAGCTDKPEVRFYLWAWNAQMGLMVANGGPQSTKESLMCKNGVNLKLIREDNVDTMQSLMLSFGEQLKAGENNPDEGAHFVAIMGDGSASFLKGLNDNLHKLGDDYTAMVVGSAGFSRGEDKFMGPPAWKENPQAARGGLVAGYLRDGDWNIALKWLGDNQIPNNPDEGVYDPEALNWVAASDYIDAGQKYINGFCVDLKHKKTGAVEKHCVDGVVTWTPGDVTVAKEKGGLVSVVSTAEYRSQMPNVIIGHKKWMAEHRDLVVGMLGATLEAGDQIKQDDKVLQQGAQISALVYNEQTPDYWYRYFTIQHEKDKQGLDVELGGSSVNNVADNLALFGMSEGSVNTFAATYTVFAMIVNSQYPALMPEWYPVEEILDTSYLKEVAAKSSSKVGADAPTFGEGGQVVPVSRRTWDIGFKAGSAEFTPESTKALEQLLNDLVIASGTLVEVHGHTDNQGSVEKNMQLSEDRAFAVKKWLEKKAPANFPAGRIKVFAHGQAEPIESNGTPEGRAKNNRVEIGLGASK